MPKSSPYLLLVLLLGAAVALYFLFLVPTSEPGTSPPLIELEEAMPSSTPATDSRAASPASDTAITLTREQAAPVAPQVGTPLITSVRVFDSEGVGVPHTRVLPWLGEQLQEEVLTNELGEATLYGLSGTGGYAVMAPGYLAVHAAYEFDGSPIVVHLADGQEFAGRVVFKRPPTYPAPFEMRVFSLPAPKVEGIPSAVKDELWSNKASISSVRVRLDDNGHFRVTGLPSDWSGRIRMPKGYMACSVTAPGKLRSYDFIDIPEVTNDLVIHATELPAFTGRVVAPDGGTPVAGVRVVLVSSLTKEKDDSTLLMGVSAEDGRFHLPITGPNSSNVEAWCDHPQDILPYQANVSLSNSSAWADVRYSLELGGNRSSWNLGDLAMKERVALSFRAVDQQGNPIAGALAYSFELSEPVDENGFGEVSLSDEIVEVTVGAPGYESVTKKVPASLTDVVNFVLPQAVRLHVSWVVPEGADMSTATFRIYSEGHVFAASKGSFDYVEGSFLRASGVAIRGGRGPGPSGNVSCHWKLRADQSEFYIWGLKPGVPMTVMIAGLTGAPLAESPPLTFQVAEERELELLLPFAPLNLVGKVVDTNGAAIPAVRVMVHNSKGSGWGGITSKEGEFRFEGLAAKTVRLTLKKDGFARLNLKEFEIPRNGAPVQIVMERAREVTVFLRDASGNTYTSGFLTSPGTTMDDALAEDGGVHIGALPQGEFLIAWQIGGAHGEEWVPEGVDEFVVEVPVMASVRIHARRSLVEENQSVSVTFVALDSARLEDELPNYERSFSMEAGQSTIDQELSVLLPGEYQVKYFTWREVDGKWGDVPIGEQGPVFVAAGEVLELNLDF